MSIIILHKLIEQRYNTVSAGVSVAFPNVPLKPVSGVPYERLDYLMSQTENPTQGGAHERLIGLVQISLHYPLNAGAGAALTRAELLKSAFVRGTTLTEGSVMVRIMRSPWVDDIPKTEAWYRVAVSIPFQCDVNY